MSKEIIKNLTSILNEFEQSRGMFEIFKDVVEICSISEHQEVYNLGLVQKNNDYEILEKRYLEIIKPYSRLDLNLIVKFYAELKSFFLKKNYDDVLGLLYMNLELGNKRSGQFFTPYHISRFMAEIQLCGMESIIEKQGYFSISDPCVGAGGMIIAASDVMNNHKINQNQMIFQAVDSDKQCFNMCYTQLSMLRLNGVVIWGNSLSCELYESRKTPALILSYDQAQNENVKKLVESIEIIQTIQQQSQQQSEKLIQLTLF